jgi:CHASE3 domain sensor protein
MRWSATSTDCGLPRSTTRPGRAATPCPGIRSCSAPQQAATAALPLEFDTLRSLTADNPVQQRYLDELSPLLRDKQRFDDRLIATRDAHGLSAASTLVSGGEGQRLMDAIREVMARMRIEEERLTDARKCDGGGA